MKRFREPDSDVPPPTPSLLVLITTRGGGSLYAVTMRGDFDSNAEHRLIQGLLERASKSDRISAGREGIVASVVDVMMQLRTGVAAANVQWEIDNGYDREPVPIPAARYRESLVLIKDWGVWNVVEQRWLPFEDARVLAYHTPGTTLEADGNVV